MNTNNKTTAAALEPITKLAYKRLMNQLEQLQHRAQFSDDAKMLAKNLQARIAPYQLACPGEAHNPAVGGMIDNCMICAPQWGIIQNPALTKK